MRRIWKWIRTDGLLHIETSALIVIAIKKPLTMVIPSWAALGIAVISCICVGIAKEVYDYSTGKGTAEMHDLWCDVIGIAIGTLLALSWPC